MREQKIIESLSPIERKILPHLLPDFKSVDEIAESSGTDRTTALRALEFLKNKKLAEVKAKEKKIIDLDVNGILYLRKGLPERKLLNEIAEKKSISLDEIKKTGLSEDEAKASIGVLKKKALVTLANARVIFNASKEEIVKKMLEEKFIESLPRDFESLGPEEKLAFQNLRKRKRIILTEIKKEISAKLTGEGEKISKANLDENLIETLNAKLIQSGNWKGKKFRRYDIHSPVPRLYGGKRHFVNQATDYAKKIWLELGFKEMTGSLVQTGFWNFDALFTAQDHPVREMQDTFFIKNINGKLPGKSNKSLVGDVKKMHEGGAEIAGGKSIGWQYKWNEKDAERVLLRTHTTCLSAQTLKKIADNREFPAKYFALGKCFRNETVDWSHGFEFNQTEGIVVDENANFCQLLGYLKEFFRKMGYEKIRIRPGYFPYTEPSLEIDAFHPVHKKWVELGGAGMFRPEVTVPFFGRHIPVLAWGPGFDRIIMEFFKIQDLRDMYKNNINKLREMKFWLK